MCRFALRQSKLNCLPLTSNTMRVSYGIAPDASLLYCKIGNVSVLPPPHFSLSTGTDLSSVEGRPLCRLSEVLISARCTQIFRWIARCGSSAMYVLPCSNSSRANPKSLANPLFKNKRFLADICKRTVGVCRWSSAPKGSNTSSFNSQTL